MTAANPSEPRFCHTIKWMCVRTPFAVPETRAPFLSLSISLLCARAFARSRSSALSARWRWPTPIFRHHFAGRARAPAVVTCAPVAHAHKCIINAGSRTISGASQGSNAPDTQVRFSLAIRLQAQSMQETARRDCERKSTHKIAQIMPN